MKNLFGSLDLTILGKLVREHPELVRKAQFKDGEHKLLSIDVHSRKEIDQYSNIAFIKASCKKENQKEGVSYYIANLKESKYQGENMQQQAQQPPTQQQPKAQPEGDELPF